MIECAECASGFFLSTNTDHFLENTCFSINLVDNCTGYDIRDNLSDSELTCNSCDTEYYLDTDNNLCIKRNNLDSECDSYHATEDRCILCNANFILDDDNFC